MKCSIAATRERVKENNYSYVYATHSLKHEINRDYGNWFQTIYYMYYLTAKKHAALNCIEKHKLKRYNFYFYSSIHIQSPYLHASTSNYDNSLANRSCSIIVRHRISTRKTAWLLYSWPCQTSRVVYGRPTAYHHTTILIVGPSIVDAQQICKCPSAGARKY